MRNGISSELLMSGLAFGVRLESYRGGHSLAYDIGCTKAALDYTSKRDVPGELTFTATADWLPVDPWSPLAAFGQRIRATSVYRGVGNDRYEVKVGDYKIDSWSENDDGTIDVVAKDLMQVLADNPVGWPSSPPRGATLLSELKRLSVGLDVRLDRGVPNRAVPRTTQFGNDRVEAVNKLADSYGFGLRVGNDGILHAYPLADSADRARYVYRFGEMLLEAPRAPLDSTPRPNRWIVTGTKTDGKVETKWTAVREATLPPYNPDEYGWITDHQEFSAADTKQAVEQAADTYMAKALASRQARSISIIPDPRVEIGDVVTVKQEDGTFFSGVVTAYSLPLTDPTQTMRVDLDVMSW